MKSVEQDIHVWAKPETPLMEALYTVSIGQRALCVNMPIDQAATHIRAYLLEMVGKAE